MGPFEPSRALDADSTAQALQRVVHTGTPLATGLRAYAEECPTRARAGLLSLANTVEMGMPLEAALESPQLALPPYLTALIKAGTRTGRLGAMLEEYLRQRRRQKRVGQRLTLDLVYPAFVLYFSLVLGLGMLGFVTPMFGAIFGDFGVELPALTELLISLSSVVVFLRVPIAIGMVMLGVGLLFLLFGGRWLARIMERLPWLGSSARAASYSEFCSLLAPLVESEQPLPVALQACAAGMSDTHLRRQAKILAADFDGAIPLEDAAIAAKLPKELTHLFSWEQRGKAFGEILRSWADLFAQMSEGRSGVIMAWLTPLLVVAIGMLIGMMVIAMFLPLMRTLNQLS